MVAFGFMILVLLGNWISTRSRCIKVGRLAVSGIFAMKGCCLEHLGALFASKSHNIHYVKYNYSFNTNILPMP